MARSPSRRARGGAGQVSIAPDAHARLLRHHLRSREPFFVPSIRRDRQRLREAATYHLQIDHRAADPDVGEQPSVAVAALPVHLEPDALAPDERHVEPCRRLAAALASHAVVSDLRRVDADVPNALDPTIEADVDGVAVVDVDHRRLEGRRRVHRQRRGCDGDRDRQENRKTRRGSHDGTITRG